MSERQLVLASHSPRRRELLSIFGRSFEVKSAQCDESADLALPVWDAVELLARRKAEAVADLYKNALVIGADTLVEFDGHPLGKPAGREEARAMLKRMSGKVHRVYTGVCAVSSPDRKTVSAYEKTEVAFRDLTDDLIESYLDTGEPFDKAGAYGIQGMGGVLVREIRGDFQNVVGLPLARLYEMLKQEFGVDLLRRNC